MEDYSALVCGKEPVHFASVAANFSIPFDDLNNAGIDGAIGDLRHNSNRRVTDLTYWENLILLCVISYI